MDGCYAAHVKTVASRLRTASFLACVFAGVLAISGCGGATGALSASSAPPASNLNGIWLLAGSLPPAGFALTNASFGFAADFTVTGTTIRSAVNIAEICHPGLSLGVDLVGTEDADGSFTLTLPFQPMAGGGTVTITGHVPSQPGAAWTGTYSIVNPSNSTCPSTVTGQIQAVSLPLPTGSFQGQTSASVAGASSPQPVTVQLQLQETAGTNSALLSGLPFEGSIALQGAGCLENGTTSLALTPLGGPATSAVQGNAMTAYFGMNDGSTMLVSVAISALDSTKLSGSMYTVVNGTCPLLQATSISLDKSP